MMQSATCTDTPFIKISAQPKSSCTTCSNSEYTINSNTYDGTITSSFLQTNLACSQSYSIDITNNLPSGYELYAKRSTQLESDYVRISSTSIFSYDSPFSLNVAVKSTTYTDCQTFQEIVSNISVDGCHTPRTFSSEHIPAICQPYSVNITNSLPSPLRLYYKKGNANSYTEVTTPQIIGDQSSFNLTFFAGQTQSSELGCYFSSSGNQFHIDQITVDEHALQRTFSVKPQICYRYSVKLYYMDGPIDNRYSFYYHIGDNSEQGFCNYSSCAPALLANDDEPFTVVISLKSTNTHSSCFNGAEIKSVNVNRSNMIELIDATSLATCRPYSVTLKNNYDGYALYYQVGAGAINPIYSQVLLGGEDSFEVTLWVQDSNAAINDPCKTSQQMIKKLINESGLVYTFSGTPGICQRYRKYVQDLIHRTDSHYSIYASKSEEGPYERACDSSDCKIAIGDSDRFTLYIFIKTDDPQYPCNSFTSYKNVTVQTTTLSTELCQTIPNNCKYSGGSAQSGTGDTGISGGSEGTDGTGDSVVPSTNATSSGSNSDPDTGISIYLIIGAVVIVVIIVIIVVVCVKKKKKAAQVASAPAPTP